MHSPTLAFTGDRILATCHRQMVKEFFIPFGRTCQWWHFMGASWLMEGTKKAKRGALARCRGIWKKQSLISITANCQFWGSIEGDGIPGWRDPMSLMTSFIFLRSWGRCHLSFPGSLMTNTGEFQGLFVSRCYLWPIVPPLAEWVHLIFVYLAATDLPRQVFLWANLISGWSALLQWLHLKMLRSLWDFQPDSPLGHGISPPQGELRIQNKWVYSSQLPIGSLSLYNALWLFCQLDSPYTLYFTHHTLQLPAWQPFLQRSDHHALPVSIIPWSWIECPPFLRPHQMRGLSSPTTSV